MSKREICTDEVQALGSLRFSFPAADPAWERDRDARLAQFIAACLVRSETTGCTVERELAEGIRDVFAEWQGKREHALSAGNDMYAAQISALGWALRCIAHRAWNGAPGWVPAFHPQAVGDETIPEVPA
ncbi:hypothetical protein [Streptomyces sp. NPDC051572]|uniref:hypothetical protein n=1 Tax=Streptomyces sp. NPDC051572 TaxID=3155802 RepID=UPI00344C4E08